MAGSINPCFPSPAITLTKSGDRWLLPELQKLPVNDSRMTELLSKLQGLKTGWPVATTRASRERFEVEEDKFQRRIQWYQDDTLAGELLVGTSPGFRKTHIRKVGDDAIYTAELNSYELPVQNDGWLDKSLLSVATIDSIKGPDYSLRKTEGQWSFANANTPAQGESIGQTVALLNVEKARQLASAVTSLRVNAVASSPTLPGLAEGTATRLEVSGPDDNWIYHLLQTDDKYFISRNDRDTVFSISKFDYERVANTRYAQLVIQPDGAENSNATEELTSDN